MALTIPGSEIYDMTILYMSDVTNWCEYLFDIFNPFEVYQQSEEITEFPTHQATIKNIRNSRVQLLIISPKFIETVTPEISEITGPESVVGLLCGVEQEELSKLKDRVAGYEQWHLVNAGDGPQRITQDTLAILEKMSKLADRQYPDPRDDPTYMDMTNTQPPFLRHKDGAEPEDLYLDMGDTGQNQDIYVVPGMNREIIGTYFFPDKRFEEPIDTYDIVTPQEPYPDDTYDGPCEQANLHQDSSYPEDTYDIHGTYHRQDSLSPEDTYDIQGSTLPVRSHNCSVYPDRVRAGVSEKVVVIFKNSNIVQDYEAPYKIHLSFGGKSADVVPKFVNPYTLLFNSPTDLPGGNYKCSLSHNGKQKATFRLQIQSASVVLSDILSKAFNPLNFLCDALEISPGDANQLDNYLHNMCKDFMPQGGFRDLFPQDVSAGGKQNCVYPTPLHFAAEFGLLATCATLCRWPGATQALKLKNSKGQIPEQMAKIEQVRTYLMGSKDQQSHGTHDSPGYVEMNKDKKKADSGYDSPFRVPIPFTAESKINDEEIIEKLQGDVNSLYDFYDAQVSKEKIQRDPEGEEDDDDAQDYETVDTPATDETPATESSRIPRTPVLDEKVTRETDEKLQKLIDIQNRVKSNEISMDEAVMLFKEWEQSHKNTQLKQQSVIGGAPRESKVQRFINKNFISKNIRVSQAPPLYLNPAALIAEMNYQYPGVPQTVRGPRPVDPLERPEKSPTAVGTSRVHANGNTDSSNWSPTETNRGDNLTSLRSGVDAPPPRSPRPTHPTHINQPTYAQRKRFDPDYDSKPIPPIPPRITSTNPASSTSPVMAQKLPPGARSVLPLSNPSSRPKEPQRSPLTSERSLEGFDGNTRPPDDLPDREAPPPPPQRSQDKANLELPRRQSDGSVTPGMNKPPGTKQKPLPSPRTPRPPQPQPKP